MLDDLDQEAEFLAAYGAAEDAYARALAAFRADPHVRRLQLFAYIDGVAKTVLLILAPIGFMHLFGELSHDGWPSLASRYGVLLGVAALGVFAAVRGLRGRVLPDIAAEKAEAVRESLLHAARHKVRGTAYEVIDRAKRAPSREHS